MRIALTFITFFILTGCFLKKKQLFLDNSGGMVLYAIDSSIMKDTRLVHFGRTVGVVFPAEFGKRHFGKWGRGINRTYFTPDTGLIKSIDREVFNQYCSAVETSWQRELASLPQDSTHKPVKEDKTAAKFIADKYCKLWKETFPFYDRQYLGYTTAAGEKVISIRMLDFREDPHHLKPLLAVSWIDGWHGWFYNNVVRLFYYVDSNKLTFKEDS